MSTQKKPRGVKKSQTWQVGDMVRALCTTSLIKEGDVGIIVEDDGDHIPRVIWKESRRSDGEDCFFVSDLSWEVVQAGAVKGLPESRWADEVRDG